MTTASPQKRPDSKPPKEKKESNSKAGWIAFAITLVLLLSASGYLYYDNEKVKALNAQQKNDIETLEKRRDDLIADLKRFQDDLDKMKGENDSLNAVIDDQKRELEEKIQQILRYTNQTKKINTLTAQVKDLSATKEQNEAKINELLAQIEELKKANEKWQSDYQALQARLSAIEGEKSDLQKKVDLASVLHIDDVLVVGEIKGKKGGYTKTTKLRKSDRFFVTFEIAENKVSPAGEKSMLISLSDPKGKVIENAQSGTFVNADNNIQTPYTQKVSFSYNNSKQRENVAIDLNGHVVQKGAYTFQFYSEEGFLCGVKKVTIK